MGGRDASDRRRARGVGRAQADADDDLQAVPRPRRTASRAVRRDRPLRRRAARQLRANERQSPVWSSGVTGMFSALECEVVRSQRNYIY